MYAMSNYIILVPIILYCFKYTPLSIKDFRKAVLEPILISASIGIVIYIVRLKIYNLSDFHVLTACASIGIISYILCWSIYPGGRKYLTELIKYIRILTGPKALSHR